MDYSTESSEGQQNVTIGAKTEPHLVPTLDAMQFLAEQWDVLLNETVNSNAAVLEAVVKAVIDLRRLAKDLGIDLPISFGRGWAAFSYVDVARSLVSEQA